MEYNQLKLENQLCFPVYAASRLIIREYQPFLDKLGITYPQYLVMLVLWETNHMPVNDIAKRLVLNTNTITPLLKRLESMNLLSRSRSDKDERKVIVSLSDKGIQLKIKASEIPVLLAEKLKDAPLDKSQIENFYHTLHRLIDYLQNK